MTKEEAIKVLNGILHLNYRNFWDEECDEAINVAIGALSEDKTDRMTREEAIADIKNNIKPVVGGKSLDLAIEALSTANLKSEFESADAVQLKQTDTLIIADALRYLAKDTERHLADRTRADALRQQILQYGASMCSSAEAEPKRVLQGYNKGANTIQTIRHEELTQIANTRKAVETADAVQGEWIHDGQNFKGGLDWCHCSVCGQKTSTNGLSMYNYCPNCGAKMKGGDDE